MSGTVLSLSTPAIAPSILTADFGQIREEIQHAERAGVELIHLDIMDGHFVPNITFGPLVVSAVRGITNLPLDVHLMIEHPDRYIDAFADAGADIVTVHVEAAPHIHRVVEQIRGRDIAPGVAINPGTPLSALESIVSFIDLVLVMSVNPGFGGQSFIPESIDKIRKLRDLLAASELDQVRIEVDGGINSDTIAEAARAGGQLFVTGSSVFNDRMAVEEAVGKLRAALDSVAA